jgi:hypothetical protein
MSIPGAAECGDDFVSALDRLGKLIARDLEPRNVVVVTDTKPMKPKASHSTFRRRHPL